VNWTKSLIIPLSFLLTACSESTPVLLLQPPQEATRKCDNMPTVTAGQTHEAYANSLIDWGAECATIHDASVNYIDLLLQYYQKTPK